MKTFKLRIIAPDRIFYEGVVTAVEFNTTEGQIGILPEHVPTTVFVKPGILNIYEEGELKVAALHAGFAEILQDRVTILAEIVEWPQEIDEDRAQAAAERARERLRTKVPNTDVVRAEAALMRAMTRITLVR